MVSRQSQSVGRFFKIFSGGFCLFVSISILARFDPGRQIGQSFLTMAVRMMKILPVAFVLIGLFDVWVKRKTVENHLGETSGFKGHLWAVVLAGLVVGPIYVSFPVACAMMQKGARIGVVFTYIGASAICRIPMAIFEASFLGFRFTIIRFAVSLPLILMSSIALEKLCEHRQRSGLSRQSVPKKYNKQRSVNMENMQNVVNEMDTEKKQARDSKIMATVKKMKGKVPTPLKVMALRPGTLTTFMAHRNQVMENGPLSEKTRSLIGIGVAVAMRSAQCIETQSGAARAAGATEDEIVQAVLIASVMLGASPLRSAGCCLETK